MKALDHQLTVMEDTYAETKDEQSRIRYNFMRIAKAVLRKETYEKIQGLSQNPLKEVKPMFKELRKEKVE